MLNSQSRIHKLRSFPPNFYIKRDDELSFGVSGSKWRKALSLIPSLKDQGVKEALLIGSAHSNNVLALSQLLIENGIDPIGVLLKPHGTLQGNFSISRWMLKKIHWIEREDWPNVEKIAQSLASSQSVIIPEGANMEQSYMGAQTLAFDIMRNEEELGINFSHIFLDAGTGFTAKACLDAFSKRSTHFHIVAMAPPSLDFFSPHCTLYRPRVGASFGSISSSLFDFIAQFAAAEGVILDPLYSGKLFSEARLIAEDKKITEPSLIVHSGGALSWLGFTKAL